MFGKDTLLIPTKPLPLGYVPPLLVPKSFPIAYHFPPFTIPSNQIFLQIVYRAEYSAWAGMIVAHYGKPGVGGHDGHLRATSAAALSELRGYYSTSPGAGRSPDFSDDDSMDGIFAPRGRRRAAPGEVELMARNPSTQSTSAYADDRLRRRRNAEDDCYYDNEPDVGTASPVRGGSPMRAALFRNAGAVPEKDAGNLTINVAMNDLKKWHRKSLQWRAQFMHKLKKVASQPSLSGGAPSSVAQAAEAAMALASGFSNSLSQGSKGGAKAD